MSEYPTINVNGIYYLDTPEQRLILIEQLKKENEELKKKNEELMKKIKKLTSKDN